MVALFQETNESSEKKFRVELSGGREVELLQIDVRWLVIMINNHVQDAIKAGGQLPNPYELGDIIKLDEVKQDFQAIKERLSLSIQDAWDVYREYYNVFIETV